MHSQVNANLVLNNQIILDDHMLLSTCFNVLKNNGVHERAWDDDGFCPPNIWTKEPRCAQRGWTIQLPSRSIMDMQNN